MTTSNNDSTTRQPRKRQKLLSSSTIVELNVGGRYFSTTKETLLQHGSTYFERLLADVGMDNNNFDGGGDHQDDDYDGCSTTNSCVFRGASRDKDGRLYIDKDPELFKLVLDFLRNTFDPDDLTRKERNQLKKEALYYDLPALSFELSRPSPRGSQGKGYDEAFVCEEDQWLRNEAQSIREQLRRGVDGLPAEADNMLIDLFSSDASSYSQKDGERISVLENAFKRPSTSPNATILFECTVEQSKDFSNINVATTSDEFKRRMIEFGGPLLESFPFDKNLIVAGGAVLRMLLHDPQMEHVKKCDSDLNVFLVAQTPEHGIEAYNAILEHLCSTVHRRQNTNHNGRSVSHNQLFVIRSSRTITFCVCEPQRHIKLHLIQHPCIASVLFNIDIDCCQVAWDAKTNKVWATPTAIRAIQTGINFADPERCTSKEYEARLAKFAQRGFMVAVPGLDTEKIQGSLLSDCIYGYFERKLRRVTPQGGGQKQVSFNSNDAPLSGLAKLIVFSSIDQSNGNSLLDHSWWNWNDALDCRDILEAKQSDPAGAQLLPWKDVTPSKLVGITKGNEGSARSIKYNIERRRYFYDYLGDISSSTQHDTPNVRDGKKQYPRYPFASLSRYLQFQPSTHIQTPCQYYHQEEWTKGIYNL